jgi:uncharacterized protein
MIVDLHELRLKDEPLVVKASFSETQLAVGSKIAVLDGVVESDLKVTLNGDRVDVTGDLTAGLKLICCRCAESFSQSLDKSFVVEYWPDPHVEKEGEEHELTYGDLEIGFYRNDEIDLCGVLSEQITLEIPMKPVCREGCKGLCEICGTNLNNSSCRCERRSVDPRLDVLAEIRKRLTN